MNARILLNSMQCVDGRSVEGIIHPQKCSGRNMSQGLCSA
jgi:hypothetical protein